MLEKIVKLIELRKEPGLLSAIWILHNLVYTKNTVIDTIGIERIDRLLFFLAELINYDNAAMKDIKHCIELRQACAALAFRLFDWKTVNCGKGVENGVRFVNHLMRQTRYVISGYGKLCRNLLVFWGF